MSGQMCYIYWEYSVLEKLTAKESNEPNLRRTQFETTFELTDRAGEKAMKSQEGSLDCI